MSFGLSMSKRRHSAWEHAGEVMATDLEIRMGAVDSQDMRIGAVTLDATTCQIGRTCLACKSRIMTREWFKPRIAHKRVFDSANNPRAICVAGGVFNNWTVNACVDC